MRGRCWVPPFSPEIRTLLGAEPLRRDLLIEYLHCVQDSYGFISTDHLVALADARLTRGTVFMPFCYAEAAANLLTNQVLDPFNKIPEFKYCAVKLTPLRGHSLPVVE